MAIFCSEYRLGAALQPLSGLLVTAAFRVYLQFGWELGADILRAVSTQTRGACLDAVAPSNSFARGLQRPNAARLAPPGLNKTGRSSAERCGRPRPECSGGAS